MKKSRQVLLMGPWTHGGWGVSNAGDIDFGNHSFINYNDLRLAWFDHFLKDLRSEVEEWPSTRIFVMGGGGGKANYQGLLHHGGYWRDEEDFPLPDTRFTPYYLSPEGTLSTAPPSLPSTSQYSFDPRDPVPTIGGGISAADPIMVAGGFDQVGREDFFGCRDSLPLNARSDVLSFQTAVLEEEVEVTGPIQVKLFAASSACDTDFTAKLIDVYPLSRDYPAGVAINLTDSIIRARYRSGWEEPQLLEPGKVYEFTFYLYPTANLFKQGHRIRLDISSSNFPRFDVNPNTGGDLGIERRFAIAEQTICHGPEYPSQVILPLVER
jgi:putative CocE/NonD family hydrolase